MTTWTARVVAAVAALAGATMFSVTGAATGRADSGDDQFVAALNAHGVPGDRGAEIGIAHEWCDARNLPRIGLAIGEPPWGPRCAE